MKIPDRPGQPLLDAIDAAHPGGVQRVTLRRRRLDWDGLTPGLPEPAMTRTPPRPGFSDRADHDPTRSPPMNFHLDAASPGKGVLVP